MDLPVTTTLREISAMFETEGRRLWLVGGCVRDSLLGIVPADIDATTDATPEEQMAIYEANGVRYVPTGLKHGTITVIRNDEIYEITTLRTDVATDGRHAVVAYTRDLAVDLERRDLTINAIAMDLDGNVVDPFGGREDLAAGRVRFVGDAVTRIREDYLRILRWFRFLGRFAGEGDIAFDPAAYGAVVAEAGGLSRISVERIWSEMSRILTGRNALQVMRLVHASGTSAVIGLPEGSEERLRISLDHRMDAATTLGGYLAGTHERTLVAWKLSNAGKHRARFVAKRLLRDGYGAAAAKIDLVAGEDLRLVTDTMRLAGSGDVSAIEAWDVPVFPIDGDGLIALGMRQGLEMGIRMKRMRQEWIASDYRLTADELLRAVPA
jgi:tRNA nucleotidyltransferase (CCA-adding enzyme)